MNRIDIIFGVILLAASIAFIIKSLKATNWFSSIIFFMLAGILGLFSIGAFVQNNSGQPSPIAQQKEDEPNMPENSSFPNLPIDIKIYDVPTVQADLIEKENFYNAQKAKFQAVQEKIMTLKTELDQAEKDSQNIEKTVSETENEVKALRQKLKIAHFAQFKAEIEQEKTVDAYGEASCQQSTVENCKKTAKQKALKNAAEQGTSVLVTSETVASFLKDVNDLKIKEQEIRSQMQAVVVSHEIVEENFIGKGSVYFYKIRAVVKGQVPPALQAQILR